MKKVLSFLMLLCIATGSPVASWGGYQWNMPYQWNFPPRYPSPLLGPLFIPPRQVFPSSGYNYPPLGYFRPPPERTHLTTCQELQQLLNLPMNQQSDSIDDNCSIEWICSNLQMGDMSTTIKQDNFTNSGTQPDNNEEPRHHGGEGLIDVRSFKD